MSSLPSPHTLRSVTILGATGSIGESAIKLIELHPDKFSVEALTAQNNVKKLAEQAKKLKAKHAAIGDESLYQELKSLLEGTDIKVSAGSQAIVDAAKIPSDLVIAAIVGSAGLLPTMAAIKRGATIGLANKECLVCAGSLVMDAVKKYNATLLPVDSEHSAIFQIIDSKRLETIDKIIITASGGPFRELSKAQMARVTVEEALKHPVWNMGAKISIDSATMMNKGLEIIEAWHLFEVQESQIEVMIHPESIIHSMVSYIDGSVLAQMGTPDMSTPIAYALAWPARIQSNSAKLDLAKIGALTFKAPDIERFPALKLSRDALITGGNAPVVLNAANEIAVERFLKKDIEFLDIIRIIASTLEQMPAHQLHSIEDVIEYDKQARIISQNI